MSGIFQGSIEAREEGCVQGRGAFARLFKAVPAKGERFPAARWIPGAGEGPLPSSRIRAEGFQMLAVQEGTFRDRIFAGRCPDDANPYRLDPRTGSVREAYGSIAFENAKGGWTLLGFTTCGAAQGGFLVDASDCSIAVTLSCADGRGRIVPESGRGEGFCLITADSRESAFSLYAGIMKRACRFIPKKTPMGWCSWYSRYEKVTEDYVRDSLKILRSFPELECVLIDDGYEEHMGDWLSFSGKFPRGLSGICGGIRDEGRIPGIWLAPMIASGESELVREHPDWLALGPDGAPANSSDFTYGGWRDLPWFTLDYSIPEVRSWMSGVVREMRRKYGIRLFKLDSLYWGAYGALSFREPISGVMNLRLALEAIREGAGEDGFILGCNAPLWACAGLVDGMRIADDVSRNASVFAANSEVCALRAWTNRSLWICDPDCLVLCDLGDQRASDGEYAFHLGSILASDGIFMSGDDLTAMSEEKLSLLRRAAKAAAAPKDVQANGAMDEITLRMREGGRTISVFLNRGAEPKEIELPRGTDFMTGRSTGGRTVLAPLCGAAVEH